MLINISNRHSLYIRVRDPPAIYLNYVISPEIFAICLQFRFCWIADNTSARNGFCYKWNNCIRCRDNGYMDGYDQHNVPKSANDYLFNMNATTPPAPVRPIECAPPPIFVCNVRMLVHPLLAGWLAG